MSKFFAVWADLDFSTLRAILDVRFVRDQLAALRERCIEMSLL